MAQMSRNVNLEEIDADTLFGIDALKNQSILQKIVFWGSVIAGVFLNVLLPLYFEISSIICVFIFLGLLLIGVAFGCNYTEDMTYGKYMMYFFFKPTTSLFYQSTEDVEHIREKGLEIKKEEDLAFRRHQQANPKEQKKLLIKVVAFLIVLVISITAAFIYSSIKEKQNLHHSVEIVREVVNE